MSVRISHTVVAMPDSWKQQPTPASRLLARALEEHPDWNQSALSHVTGLNQNAISRWLHAKSNPPQERVADVARMLGYDPRDVGVTDPRALQAQHPSIVRGGDGGDAPEWFVSHSETMHAYLQALEQRAITAEQKLERILQTVERQR